MKNSIRTLVLISVMGLGSTLHAGQHSGLGGSSTPKPTPDPTLFDTVEQYYQAYVAWIREQMERGLEQPTVLQNRK